MPSECGGLERRQATRTGAAQPHPPEPDNLPCPRCDSTNTKFCYYNNYNLSQPRYFCKSCRRYWTRGGTLRNVPVGGGSRKNSKRSRATSSSSSSSSANHMMPPQSSVVMAPTMTSEAGVIMKPELHVPVTCDLNLNEGSFTSLLTANPVGVGLQSGGGLFGYGFGHTGFDEMGLGFGYGYGPTSGETHVSESDADARNGGPHGWQLGGFDGSASGGGGGGSNGAGSGAANFMDGVDYFHVA